MTTTRFYLATLGCKVNQYESHALREAWTALGCEETSRPEAARYILVNSCAVTARAVADVRATVRRLNREAPGATIIITGCAAEVLQGELAALPGVASVIKQSDKSALAALPPPANAAEPASGAGLPAGDAPQAGDHSAYPPFSVSGYDRSRAVLKIQDGCSHGCAYCIVPLTRGRARSRSYDDSLAEAKRLLASGFREIIISGVNLHQYRDEIEKKNGNFWNFLARLDAELSPAWSGKARLRLSSLEPGQLDDQALEVLSGCRLVAPHLHLSLQSGSPSVLRRMGRGHYDPATVPAFLKSLRGIWPVSGLGADILTAFPGETEEEFEETHALCRELPLSYAHVFPYSRRPGTRAALLPSQVPAGVKKERAARLRNLIREKKSAFLHSLLALPRLHVVFEDRRIPSSDNISQGICEFYADCRMQAAQTGVAIAAKTLIPVCPEEVLDGETLLVRKAGGEMKCP